MSTLAVVDRRCITSAAGADCGPAEYEWLYTEPEMNRPGGEDWIPLCEVCCAYWREQARGKPYRVRTLARRIA